MTIAAQIATYAFVVAFGVWFLIGGLAFTLVVVDEAHTRLKKWKVTITRRSGSIGPSGSATGGGSPTHDA
jgi:hypothetical protein